jgi:hypothetical protein
MPVAPSRRPWAPLLGATAIAILILALAALALLRVSDDPETKGSGVLATQTRHVPAFSGVRLSGVGDVTIRVGAPRSVAVRADDNLLDRVTTDVRGGVLVVGLKARVRSSGRLRVLVGVPRLDSLTLNGSGVLKATGVRAERLRVDLAGSGVVHADGAVTRLDVVLDGVGDVQLGNLRSEAIAATLNGTGRIVVNPARSLNAVVAGAGEIVYRRTPARLRTTVTGLGVIVSEPDAST